MHSIDKTFCEAKDDNDDTALTLASRLDLKETVELLINGCNVDIHQTGYYGRNCFLTAAIGGNNVDDNSKKKRLQRKRRNRSIFSN